MAIVTITKTKLTRNQIGAMPAAVASDATGGACIAYDEADNKILILLENAGASPITGTIEAGNGIQGTTDLSFTLAAGAKSCAVVESGRYVNTSGANKGMLVVNGGSADLKVACVVLP